MKHVSIVTEQQSMNYFKFHQLVAKLRQGRTLTTTYCGFLQDEPHNVRYAYPVGSGKHHE
jgi:hypothetical protein